MQVSNPYSNQQKVVQAVVNNENLYNEPKAKVKKPALDWNNFKKAVDKVGIKLIEGVE